MKKLFVCAMALAAFVSCSKDEPTLLETSKKSVSINITNVVSDTRAAELVAPATSVSMDAAGSVGKVLTAGKNVVSATPEQLTFLFANDKGEIVEIKNYNDAIVEEGSTVDGTTNVTHSLRFHNITEAATQIAVVKYGDMAALTVGNNLSKVRDEAASEALNKEIELDAITLYGASLLKAGGTCEYDGHKFNLYTASVEVKPMFARVEISGIECNDLGNATYRMAKNDITEPIADKGYDELTLNSIYFGTNKQYTYAWATKPVLYGEYTGNINDDNKGIRPDYQDTRIYAFDATASSTLADAATVTNANGDYTANSATTMLAWNIAPQAAPSFTAATEDAEEVISNPMVLSLNTHAYDFSNASKATTVTVKKLGNVANFEAGNVYRLYLEFGESNIDSFYDGICVDVEVIVQKWVVNIVTPQFGTNPPATPAE